MDWDKLYTECMNCRKCVLCETRQNVVFGSGDRNSEILFIGEGPGAQEDNTGESFVGRAGKLLDDMLEMIYLDRSKIFITNTVKCRPPGNRDPLTPELAACATYLERQIALLNPKIIVCLGRVAAKRMIRDDFKITQEHGQWFERDGIKYMALYHPSALLRDPHRRPETFEDLKKLQLAIKEYCSIYN